MTRRFEGRVWTFVLAVYALAMPVPFVAAALLWAFMNRELIRETWRP